MKPAKVFFEKNIIELIRAKQADGPSIRVLELGCGGAPIAPKILEACPGIEYIGIEPNPVSSARAKKTLSGFSNALVLDGLAYGGVTNPGLMKPFDVVFSLSVLEHVKDLPVFLQYAARCAKEGGDVIHLYDLGHSLYPSGLKERIQVALCGSVFRRFIPESKIACYLSTEAVRDLLEASGCAVQNTTFHNMRSLVALSNAAKDDPALTERILAFEEAAFPHVADLKERERLFPTVCFWTTKKTT